MAAVVRPRECSIADTLELVGRRWALLAVRELSHGVRRFDRIVRNTGASRDVLTLRLRELEDAGVVRRERYSDHPPRYEYDLTEAGRELRPVLTALRTWGDKWAVDAPPAAFTHSCGHDLDAALVCRHCGGEVSSDDLELRVLAPGWTREGPLTAG